MPAAHPPVPVAHPCIAVHSLVAPSPKESVRACLRCPWLLLAHLVLVAGRHSLRNLRNRKEQQEAEQECHEADGQRADADSSQLKLTARGNAAKWVSAGRGERFAIATPARSCGAAHRANLPNKSCSNGGSSSSSGDQEGRSVVARNRVTGCQCSQNAARTSNTRLVLQRYPAAADAMASQGPADTALH